MTDTVTAPPKHVGVLVVCTQEEAELLAAITRGERDTYDTRSQRVVDVKDLIEAEQLARKAVSATPGLLAYFHRWIFASPTREEG